MAIAQHVDDISNMINAKNEDELVGRAVKHALHFKDVVNDLQMDISSKSVVAPPLKGSNSDIEHPIQGGDTDNSWKGMG